MQRELPREPARLLSLSIDESPEQTRAVLRKIARRRNQLVPEAPPDLSGWHKLFHWLKVHGEHRVYIPYADHLAEDVTAAVVRMRRDFSTLLGMIESHAVLHQATRQRDEHGRIVATAAHYDAARDLLADAFAVTSGTQVPASVRTVVNAVVALAGADGEVLTARVAEYIKRDRSVAARGLGPAVARGYLVNLEDRKGRPGRYRAGPESLPDDKPALPGSLPDDACTAAQPAHLSSQVSEGCAAVQLCTRGDAGTCTICGGRLDTVLVAAGFTDHCEGPAA